METEEDQGKRLKVAIVGGGLVSRHNFFSYVASTIQFFIIYVPSQQPQGQLQTQHSVDTSNYIMDKHNIKSKTN
jgi:hypothetical protein